MPSSPEFITLPASVATDTSAVKAVGAVSSLRCGPHQPLPSPLTAPAPAAPVYAGDELRKDGGSDRPGSRRQHQVAGLRILESGQLGKHQGEKACV